MNANSSTTSNWLSFAEQKLKDIPTARLDALVLLEDALQKDRSYILAHREQELDADLLRKLNQRIERRAKHEPLAYIRGKSEFYGREFLVSSDTLEPRPETETMIEQLKKLGVKTVCDVGTGSGCLAITAKLEMPTTKVLAIEINDEALKIAKQNAAKLHAEVEFFNGNLLEPIKNKEIDVLLCNLPYVPDSHTINEAAMHEPKIAIFGGADGLDLYRQLFLQIEKRTQKPKYILTESLPFQHHGLASIARNYGYVLQKTDDFIQVFQMDE